MFSLSPLLLFKFSVIPFVFSEYPRDPRPAKISVWLGQTHDSDTARR
jgi:hypothetical protein